MDLNNDNKMDLIVGERGSYPSNAAVHYYRRLDDNSLYYEGILQILGNDGTKKDIKVSNNSSPCIKDLDQDGLPDLIVGDLGWDINKDYGYIRFYKNIGTDVNPIFSNPINLKSNSNEIRQKGAQIELYDLDLDGKDDLIVGNMDGEIYYYKNVSSVNDLIFEEGISLKSNGQKIILPEEIGKKSCQLSIADYNNDGVADILAGNAGLNIYFFEGIPIQTELLHPMSISKKRNNILIINRMLKINNFYKSYNIQIFSLSGKLLHEEYDITDDFLIPAFLLRKMCIVKLYNGTSDISRKVLIQ